MARRFPALLLIGGLLVNSMSIEANTSGVHGPKVNPTDRSMQLRFALSPADESGQEDSLAYRLHYQHALNQSWRIRGTLQYRDRGDFQYDYLRAEILYYFKKADVSSNWASGFRFDFRTRRANRPEQFAIHWTNQWDFDNQWRLRALAIISREFGSEDAASGVLFETRASVSKRLSSGLRLGIELYDGYGRLGDFDTFNQQKHQIGPTISGSMGHGLTWAARYLVGLSDSDRQHNFGFRIDKSF